METQEQIERRLAQIEEISTTPSGLGFTDAAMVIAIVRSLLPALAVARAAVALRDAQHNLSVNAVDAVPLAAVAEEAYDAALARFADAEGGQL